MKEFGQLTLAVINIIYAAWIFMLLWNWFLAPFGLPEIFISWALGLICLVTLFKKTPDFKKDDDIGARIFNSFFIMTTIVVIGWISSVFM